MAIGVQPAGRMQAEHVPATHRLLGERIAAPVRYGLCVAENPVSKVASVRAARCTPIPNLTVSLDAQESAPHQENLLLRHRVGPSVLGIVEL